jgi:threonine/homoserine/homoserine lactone efflux protein
VTLLLFIKAMIAGFVVAVPIGAIGAMCLRRALVGRWGTSLLTGFGAAAADAVLAAAAMFGLTLLTRYIFEHRTPLLLVGGCFLIFIGVRMIRHREPHIDPDSAGSPNGTRSVRGALSAVSTGFVLTAINPATLLAFVGVFAGLGLFAHRLNNLLDHWSVILGVFCGSMLWWSTLTGAAIAVRRHLSLEFIVIINVVLGITVAGFGVAALLSVIGVIPRF